MRELRRGWWRGRARCSTAARWTRPPTVSVELAKLGFPFAQATARITRDAGEARRIDVAFTVDQGPRTYVERIDIHGNTRTAVM